MNSALILVDHGSKREEANAHLFKVKDRMEERAPELIIEAAHMELADPSIEDACMACINRGAKSIQVFPYMVTPGRHSQFDIPEIVTQIAQKHPDIHFEVLPPFGIHDELIDVIFKKIDHSQ